MARREDPDRTKVAIVDPWMGLVVAGRYRLELRIAAGGFGAIYRALDLIADRDVAVKLLHPSLASDPAVLARFRREGAALASLRDPHTVAAYDVGEAEDGSLFIAMELLGGRSLHVAFREEGAMAWRRVVKIARAVCSSLAEAHAFGIVHRDLKPANIHLEGDDDFVKVLDFGIAKIVGGALDQSDLTNAGQMIGTFDYMPPEQMVGGETTGKSDVFTLGVVMYELLAGDRPFGDLPTAASMLGAMLTKPPPPPSARGAELPAELDRIVLRCLAQRPDDRPSVAQLAQQLDRLIEDDRDRTIFQPLPPIHEHTEPVQLRDRSTTDRMAAVVPAPDEPEWKVAPSDTIIILKPADFLPATTLPGVAAPKQKSKVATRPPPLPPLPAPPKKRR